MVRHLVDAVLDRTLVGYTRVGYRLRSAAWTPLARMDGRVVAITGATSGIGFAAAEAYARLGAGVHLLVRSPERGERARATIRARQPDAQIDVIECDLSRLTSVRRCVAELDALGRPLHVLVHNAGVLTDHRTLSPDGIELTLATNVVGPFLLTNLLTRSSPAARPAGSSRSPQAGRIRSACASTTCRWSTSPSTAWSRTPGPSARW